MLIADTIHNSIMVSKIEKEIISLRIFNRLHNISQTSTTYLTFPSNKTRRFEHSIGTMHLAGNFLKFGLANASNEDIDNFFGDFRTNIQEIVDEMFSSNGVLGFSQDCIRDSIEDRNFNRNKLDLSFEFSPDETVYLTNIPSNVSKYTNEYLVLFEAVRLAGILHDIGHPPFSHITEDALTDLYKIYSSKNKEERNSRQNRFVDTLYDYFENDEKLHESVSKSITLHIFKDILSSKNNKDSLSINKRLLRIFTAFITMAILTERNSFFKNIHKIIDGALDSDRLDYVSRDVINSGVSIGIIEYDRLIFNTVLRCYPQDEDTNEWIFCQNSKNIEGIEDFFRRRWKMYKDIIHHHRVVKTDYLLQECLIKISKHYLDASDKENESNIEILPYDISGLWKALDKLSSIYGRFNLLMQWDDNWLLTILKKHYFEDYFESKKDIILEKQLEELLANKKYFVSMIKKQDDFYEIDKATLNYLKERNIEAIDVEKQGDIVVNFFEKISNWDVNTYISGKRTVNNTILSELFLNTENFYKKVVNDAIAEVAKDKIEDYMLVFKNRKTGTKESLLISKGNDVKRFNDISKEDSVLQDDLKVLPQFFLYILPYEGKVDRAFVSELRIELGESIGKKLIDFINSFDML